MGAGVVRLTLLFFLELAVALLAVSVLLSSVFLLLEIGDELLPAPFKPLKVAPLRGVMPLPLLLDEMDDTLLDSPL